MTGEQAKTLDNVYPGYFFLIVVIGSTLLLLINGYLIESCLFFTIYSALLIALAPKDWPGECYSKARIIKVVQSSLRNGNSFQE